MWCIVESWQRRTRAKYPLSHRIDFLDVPSGDVVSQTSPVGLPSGSRPDAPLE